jgi:prepilin peptidase CpaA
LLSWLAVSPLLYSACLALLVTAVAAAFDLRAGAIPNRLLGVSAALGVGVSAATAAISGNVLRALALAAAGPLLVSIVPLLLYRAGGLGAGDVKLLALVGLLLGPVVGLEVELYAFTLTLLYAPARLIWEGKLWSSMRALGRMLATPVLPQRRRPPPMAASALGTFRFAPAVFLGSLLAVGARLVQL